MSIASPRSQLLGLVSLRSSATSCFFPPIFTPESWAAHEIALALRLEAPHKCACGADAAYEYDEGPDLRIYKCSDCAATFGGWSGLIHKLGPYTVRPFPRLKIPEGQRVELAPPDEAEWVFIPLGGEPVSVSVGAFARTRTRGSPTTDVSGNGRDFVPTKAE